jgi:hypothetical protein
LQLIRDKPWIWLGSYIRKSTLHDKKMDHTMMMQHLKDSHHYPGLAKQILSWNQKSPVLMELTLATDDTDYECQEPAELLTYLA